MSIDVIAEEGTLGATVSGIDLGHLSDDAFEVLLNALGARGVVRIPNQVLSAAQLKAFSARLGELEVNVVNTFQEPGHPEVMVLSNVTENGKAIGLPDAGQSWHTDMSYSRVVAFANVLYALQVPRRDGVSLGATEFCDVAAAYDDLPEEIKVQLKGRAVLHDFDKFWEMMRQRPGSTRAPLTPAQRAAKPPVWHPAVIRNPLSGRRVLYVNPGYAVRVEGLPQAQGDALLEYLFAHQTREAYRYVFRWTAGDVLVWDNLRVIHQAVADYGPDEHRLMKRCQVMATKYAPQGA